MATNNTTFLDSSANALAITKNGNVGQGTLSPFAPTWSTLFSAGGDYIQAAAANTVLSFLSNNLTTVEAWICPTANLAANGWINCIIANAAGVVANGRWGLLTIANGSVNADSALMFWYTNSPSTGAQVQTTAYGIKFGKWNHVAVTIDATTPASSTVTLYVNGVGQTFTVNLSTHTVSAGTNFCIGGGYWNTLTGHISNLRVVKGSLVYLTDFTPPTSPLTPITGTVLLTCCTPTLSDESQYNNVMQPGTVTTTASEFSPFAAGSSIPYSPSNSIYFPANGSYVYKAAPGNGDFDPGATGAWTMEFWFFPTTSVADSRILGLANGTYNGLYVEYNAKKFVVEQHNGTSQVVSIASALYYEPNKWYHVAVSKDASNVIRLFIDGVQVGTQTYSGTIVSGNGFIINGGYDGHGIGSYGNAIYVSNVRWVKGTCLYAANFLPDASPLTAVANTKLLINSTTIVDTSANAYTFTLAGSTQPYVRQFCPHYTGIPATRSMYFPANGSYLYKANPGNGDFDPGATGAWTLEAWVMPTSSTSIYVLAFGNSAAWGNSLLLRYETSKFAVTQSNGSANTVYITSTVTSALNVWHHVAVSKDAANVIRLFVNGVQVGTATNSSAVATGCGVVLNGCLDSNGIGNGGGSTYLSNVRWVKGTCLYAANFVPPTSPLTAVANTKLLVTNSLVDGSSNAYTLTVGGSASFDGRSPLLNAVPTVASTDYKASTFGGSAYFDGNTGYYLSTPSSATTGLGSSNFTLEMWICPITTVASTGRITGILAAVNYPDITFYITGGYIYAAASSNGASWNVQGATAIILAVPGQWTHLAVCRSGTNMYWYVNGALKLTTNVTGVTFHATSALHVGWDGISGDPTRFRGYISGVRLVKSDLYKTSFLPSTAVPTAVTDTALLMNFSNIGVWDAAKCTDWQTRGSVATQDIIYKSGSGSLSFNGTSDYMVSNVTGPYNQLNGRAFTIEFWAFPTAWAAGTTYNEYRSLIGASSNVSTQGWRIMIGTSAQGVMFFEPNGGGYTNKYGAPVTLNAWQHFAFVYDGANMSVYKNGILTSGPTAISWTNTTDALNMGALVAGSYGYYYAGYLDSVQISYGVKYTADFAVSDAANLDKSTNKVTRPSCQLLLTGDGSTNLSNLTPMDSSVNYTSVSRNGNPYMGSFSPFGDNWSVYNEASANTYYFAASSRFNLSLAQGDFTIEFWFKMQSYSSAGRYGLFGEAYYLYAQGGWAVWLDSGELRFVGNSNNIKSAYYGFVAGQWYHVAVTRQGTTYMLFVDGGLIAKGAASSGVHPADANTAVTFNSLWAATPLSAYCSNARIVKGTALYTAPFSVPTSPLTNVPGTVLLTYQSNKFVDNSPYNNAVLVLGSPVIKRDSPFLPVYDATKNGSVYFDGSSYLTSGTVGNFNNQAWTVEAWFNITSYNTGTMGVLQSVQGKGVWIPYVAIFVTNAGLLNVTINGAEYISTTKVDVGVWHHVALERTSGGTVTLYCNGVATNVTRTDNIDSASLTFFVGRCANADLSYVYNFKGHISNVRLTVGTAVYGGAFAPSTIPLTASASTKLLTCQSYGLVDKSGGSVSVTSTGTPLVADVSPFPQMVPVNSVYMNGSSNYLSVASAAPINFGTGDFTVEGWFFRVGAMPNANVFFSTSVTGGLSFYTNTTTSSNTLFGIRAEGYPATEYANYGQTMRSEQWHHVAAVRKNGVVAMYLDGKLATATGSFTANLVQQDILIGRSGSTYWQGYVCGVRVAKSALYDISQTYIRIPTGPVLSAGTLLHVLQNNGLTDGSPNAFTVNANGSVLSDFNAFQTGSLVLDGSSNVTVPASANYAFGTGDFTIEGWFYVTGFNVVTYNYALLATNRVAANTGAGTWGITLDTSYGLSFCEIVNSPTNRVTSSEALKPNCWYHIAVTRKTGTSYIFVNGKNRGTATDAINYSSSSNIMVIGQDPTYSFMKGNVHGFRVVKGTALYTADFVPPKAPALSRTANEVLNLPFQDVSIVDRSGNFGLFPTGANLKPSTTVAAKSGSTSLYFDGASYLTVRNSSFCFDGDFTIEWWQYQLTAVVAYPTAFALDGNNPSDAYHMNMYINVGGSGHSLNVANTSLNGWSVAMSLGGFPSLNAWHHYAITRNGSTWKVFIDGVQAGTATYAGALAKPADGTFTIGYAGASNSYFKGYIDNFKITIGECLYNAPFTPTY